MANNLHGIPPHLPRSLDRAPLRVFQQAAGATASKVSALVVWLLISLASFVLLPLEGAFTISGVALLCSLMCCHFQASAPNDTVATRWYHPFTNFIPVFFSSSVDRRGMRNGVPPAGYVGGVAVRTPGNRVSVGHGHRNPLPPHPAEVQAQYPMHQHPPQQLDRRPHVPVGRG